MAKSTGIPEKSLEQYDLIVSEIDGVERKGKGSPYTSINGNMFTMMRKDGVLGIRLSKEDRELFMEKYGAREFENYGSMIREYVEVPEKVLMDKEVMVDYLKRSFEYTKTLKAKATKKKPKSSTKSNKKVTHEVGKQYKNGQLKSEIKGDQLINYFEDGSVKAQGMIKNEKMEGKWVFNRKGGQLWQIGHFKADAKNGEFIRYDSKGDIAYHVVFENGKVVKKLY
ncbi:hypothetical protein R9X47_09500 [Wukongibacter baidiensis]|uniref:hypothetical protein n=1 Tax=Wukongibacter baidiensis TaxID=1723361 RepID=UPI003D7F852C